MTTMKEEDALAEMARHLMSVGPEEAHMRMCLAQDEVKRLEERLSSSEKEAHEEEEEEEDSPSPSASSSSSSSQQRQPRRRERRRSSGGGGGGGGGGGEMMTPPDDGGGGGSMDRHDGGVGADRRRECHSANFFRAGGDVGRPGESDAAVVVPAA